MANYDYAKNVTIMSIITAYGETTEKSNLQSVNSKKKRNQFMLSQITKGQFQIDENEIQGNKDPFFKQTTRKIHL